MTARRNTAPGALGDSAAPAGGTAADRTLRCRGCRPILAVASAASLALVVAGPVRAESPVDSVTLPSGLEALAWDTIEEAPLYRARYLAPELAEEAPGQDVLAADLSWLCAEDALPRLRAEGADPSRIVVSLMAEPVEFGVMTPNVAQVFESYTVEGSRCIWEAF